MSHTLLFEIGVEELPASFVDGALAALPGLAQKRLAELRLGHTTIRAFGTPRRLGLLVADLDEVQPDLDEELVGPPEAVAFKEGVPSKAAEAFAKKLGIEPSALVVAEVVAGPKQKAGRFVVGRRRAAGQPARELLGAALAGLAGEIPFRKSMRWGAGSVAFGRPVQWLVALLDEEILDVEFAQRKSGRSTRGHRFLAPAEFDLATASDYEAALAKAHVIVDRDARERIMSERIASAAAALGGRADAAAILVTENRSLVEEPFVVQGEFEARFLELPADVIRAVARGHQRYFCLEREDGSLLPQYLSVVNTALDPQRIAKGQDRVMRARLSDAAFFFAEDKKVDLEERVEKLSGIVFHVRLGTVRDKVARIERLAVLLARQLGAADELAAKVHLGAHLCKFDLVSLMVGEFPELQGEMGRVYATAKGLDPEVAAAISEHYKPIGADGELPTGLVASCVAMADRLDTLAGCFAAGLEPTGTADPYALRRNDIALLRFFLDGAIDGMNKLDLGVLFGLAYDGFAESTKLDLDRAATVQKLLDFSYDRLRNLLAQRTSAQAADVALAGNSAEHAAYPALAAAKAHAIHAAHGEAWLAKAKLVAKRLAGISKASAPVLHDAATFTRDEDARIVALVHKLDQGTRELADAAAVRRGLESAEYAATELDAIFEGMLVNDPADAHTEQRLELLSFGASCMLRLGDFTKLG